MGSAAEKNKANLQCHGSQLRACLEQYPLSPLGPFIFHRLLPSRLPVTVLPSVPFRTSLFSPFLQNPAATDLQFARTSEGHPVPFATAGDCYSAAKCPQVCAKGSPHRGPTSRPARRGPLAASAPGNTVRTAALEGSLAPCRKSQRCSELLI